MLTTSDSGLSSFRIFRPAEGARIKSCTTMGSRVLQLSLLLVGLCQPFCASAPDASSSQEAGEVPVSQLKMLSLGLAHLLQGVDGNAKGLEQQGEHVATELDRATKNLESLRKHSFHAGRTHRQVRESCLMKGIKVSKQVSQENIHDLLCGSSLSYSYSVFPYTFQWKVI